MPPSLPACALDAALYAPAPVRRPRQRGRSRKKGERLPALSLVLADTRTQWTSLTDRFWYGEQNRVLQVASATALWYHSGMTVIALCWFLIRDPLGKYDTETSLCTVQQLAEACFSAAASSALQPPFSD